MGKLWILILMAFVLPAVTVAKAKKKEKHQQVEKIEPVRSDSVATGHADSIIANSATDTDSDHKDAVSSADKDVIYESEIERLKKERDFFKTYYVKEIRKSVATDREYLSGSFAELNADKIAEIVDRYKPCAEDDEFAGIIKLATTSLENQKAYEAARHLMAEDGPVFTPALPLQVMQELAKIHGPLSATQTSEIETLKEIAEVYPRAIQTFKARIKTMREEKLDREGAATNKGYAASIQTDDLPPYLASNEIKNEYRYRISRVPKLKAIYDEWLKLLTKNFMDPRVIEIEESVLRLEDGNNEQ